MTHSLATKTAAPQTVPTSSQQDETWLRDGILCQMYRRPMTLQRIADSQQRAMDLVVPRRIVVPLIVVLEGEGKKIKIGLGQLGRASNHEVIKHISIIIIVGTKGVVASVLRSATHLFFKDRIKYCDTFEQALAIAQPYVGKTVPILE